MPTKEMPSFPHQWCGSPATFEMCTAKTQPGLFPSTESIRMTNMERGESLLQHNAMFHIEWVFTVERSKGLSRSQAKRRCLIQHIQTGCALSRYTKFSTVPPSRNTLWDEKLWPGIPGMLDFSREAPKQWTGVNWKNIQGSCHHTLF